MTTLVPMNGQTADKVFAAQKYKIDKIAANMFTAVGKLKDKRMVPPTKFPGMSIQKVWDYAFADNTEFLKIYHDKRRETDLVVGTWEYAPDKGSGYRVVTLTTLVDVPRADTPTPLEEAHRFAYCTTPEGKVLLTYHISSQTPDVTAGSTFRTEALAEFTADSVDGECTITFWGNCKKMSMTFAAIQYIAVPRAIREMTAAYKMMVDMILENLCGKDAAAAAEKAPAEAEETPSAGAITESGGGDAGGGEPEQQEMALQGILLLLSLIITVVLVFSLSSLRQLSGFTKAFISDGSTFSASLADKNLSKVLLSQLEPSALLSAAQDAQIQSLRTRWLDQKVTISALESTVNRMWWYECFLTLVVILMLVKMFVL
ncbi:hypothetical protein AGDE_03905 [Angomonas deanei]|nr:hypothetical protein AGDE_03905 [Angomonas deanei]|eukprot:EPY40023.1 hypothetical protein AGDE_03905 [Angomonas deanei]